MRKLRKNEINWIKIILKANIMDKKVLITQAKKAKIKSEFTSSQLLYKFFVPAHLKPYPNDSINYIFAEAKQPNGDTIALDLHLFKGYIFELKVYSIENKKINQFFSIENSMADIGTVYIHDGSSDALSKLM